MTASNTLVIGIGNEFRRDDSAGILAAERLKARVLPGIEVISYHGEGTGLMALWQGRGRVIVIDAVTSKSPAGTLHLIDTVSQSLPPDMKAFSSHAFGLAEAVELARDLGTLPNRLWIVGVEGKDFSPGQELSPEVAESLGKIVQKVIELSTSPA